MLTLHQIRRSLVIAEYNTYSPDHFPGSQAWQKNKDAADALKRFDAKHQDIADEAKAQAEAERKSRYDELSDFVKMGS